MPRYHSLDTEVQLCTSSPLSCQSVRVESSVPVIGTQAPGSHSASRSISEVPKSESSFSGRFLTHYRDQCPNLKRLNEEYFKGRKGLDFLGYDAPFFLIHAGNDPSKDAQPSCSWIGTNKLLNLNQERPLESSEEHIGTSIMTITSPTEKAVPHRAHESSRVNERQPYPNEYGEIYSPSDESPLSSPPSAGLPPLHDNHLVSEGPHVETGGQLHPSFLPHKVPKWMAEISGIPSRAQSLRNLNQTIQVVVKLSEKSFIYPVSSAEDKPYDICINIFCNGEFYTSHIVNYSTWAGNGMKNYLIFGARCTGMCDEVPRIINTSDNSQNTRSLISESAGYMTPLERWDKLTRILLSEAKNWGSDEPRCRCPTGEYLELLSEQTMPFELNIPLFSTGSGFGVIDVVITLGLAFQPDNAAGINSPTLNLSKSQSQTAGKVGGNVESRVATPSLATIRDFPEDSSILQLLNDKNYSITEVDTKGTKRSSSTTEMSHIMTISAQHVEQINSSIQGGLPLAAETVAGINSQPILRKATSMSVRSPATLAIVPTPRPPHPNRPDNAPQKTYRGSETIVAPSPSTKLHKTAKLFEELPFDLNTAAYMSTRARRSASIPFAQTPPKAQLESSLKRKRNALSSFKPSEESSMGTSSMPKKDKPSNPKTPESGGPVKKKLRTSNYNPKLSNRPQNLRRKNSAGEWIIPPCRKNSSGEWETPTKEGQAKAAGFLGAHANGATTSENEKIFQPVFNMPVENTSLNMLIAANNTSRILVNNGEVTLKENIQQNGSAGEGKEIAHKIVAIEESDDIIHSANPGNRSNAVAITARDKKFTPPKLTTIFRGVKSPHHPVKNPQNGELLVASPTAAGEIDFENFFGSKKMGSKIFGKNSAQKRTLCLRFFEGNINSAGEIVDVGYGSKRWLARRCITPEHIPAPVSNPSFEQPKPKISALAAGPKRKKVEDVLTDLVTAQSRRKPGNSDTPDLGATKNPIIAVVRNDEVETAQQHQISSITVARRGFVIPNHNSRVLKLTNRQSAAKQTDGINKGVQNTTGAAVGHNIVDNELKIDASRHFDQIILSSPPVPATQDGLGKDARQSTGLKNFPIVRSIDNKQKDLSDSAVVSLIETGNPSRDSDSEAQIIEEDQVSAKMLSEGVASKRSFYSRTVGSTELRALLESHDRHSDANASFDSQPGVVSFQPLTRASKKAIKFKLPRVIGANEVATDMLISTDKSIVQNPIKSNTHLRKRSSSGQFIVKAKDTAIIPNHPKGKNGDLLKVVNAQIKPKIKASAPSFEANKPSWWPHRKGTPNRTVVPPTAYLEVPRRTSMDLEGEILQNDASNAVNVEDAAREVNVALNQMNKVGTGATTASLGNATYSLVVGEPVTGMHGSQQRNTLGSSVPTLRPSSWKPGSLYDNSITEHAEGEIWDSLENNPKSDHFCGRRGTQQDGNFKALSVLMGVRYVVVGSNVMEECKTC